MFMRTGYILPGVALALALLTSCGDTDEAISPVPRPVESVEFDCMVSDGIDSSAHTITCSRPKNADGTVKVTSFEFAESYSAYVVVGDDLDDPELDWDLPVEKDAKIPVPDSGSFAFAILDGKDRVVEVWTVVFTPDETSSSSKKESSSSDAPPSWAISHSTSSSRKRDVRLTTNFRFC